jgi:hypothetical protein
MLVVLAIALCVFVPSLIPSSPINQSSENVPSGSLPTPLATLTPLPKPTKEHIGRLIFTCTRGDFNQLCMVNADGTDFQQLTKLDAHSYYPVFSPLGGSVVYSSNQNGG